MFGSTCWTVGVVTEQERTEARSRCRRQRLTALGEHRCGAGVTPVPRLPVVTGIMGKSFPSATVLHAQPPSPASDLTLMLG